MKKGLILILFFIGTFQLVQSQKVITWEVLKNVEFDEVWSEEFQAYYMVPKFGKIIQALDGKEVQIRGFIIPVDIVQDYYVLSANLTVLVSLRSSRPRIGDGDTNGEAI